MKSNSVVRIVSVLVIICFTLTFQASPPIAQASTTFLIDEQFDNPLDPSVWLFTNNSAGATALVNDGVLEIFSGYTQGGGAHVGSSQLYGLDDGTLILEIRARVTYSDGHYWGFLDDTVSDNRPALGFLDGNPLTSQLVFGATAQYRSIGLPIQFIELPTIDSTQWHDYRIEREIDQARFYVDGQRLATITQSIYPGPMQVFFDRGRTVDPQTMYVDYVRLYRVTHEPLIVDAGGPYTVSLGDSVPLSASGTGDLPISYAWDLDNNGSFETPGQSVLFSAAGLAAPGVYPVTVQATDNGGLTATDQDIVTVTYAFSGFFPPIDLFPALNLRKAGSAVPVKFSLGGNYGLTIFEAGYPKSQEISCDTPALLVEGLDATVTSGASDLSYSDNQYHYVWKTDKAWANTCRQLVVKLVDGTYHRANFKFK